MSIYPDSGHLLFLGSIYPKGTTEEHIWLAGFNRDFDLEGLDNLAGRLHQEEGVGGQMDNRKGGHGWTR